jgi:hypothetical protein
MSNESLYRDTNTPEPSLTPSTEGEVLMNEITAMHTAMAQMRQMVSTGLFNLSSRVINLEEQDKADRADRVSRQVHVDRLLWAGLGLAAAHLIVDVARAIWGRR